jgi:hypothetical protein
MYPYQIVFTNNATTRLAASISNTATTATLSTGTGQFFPAITAGQAFTLTLSDSPTGLTREIVLVTARNGDQITMIRGQEGTNAIAWIAGTYVENRPTAKFLNSFDNLDPFYAIGGGTSNAITGELVSPLTSITDGFYVIVRALSANTTTTPTFQLTLGTTVQPVYTIVKGNNQPLVAGDISGSGFPIQLVFSTNFNAWVMLNPQSKSTLAAGSNTQVQYNLGGSLAGSAGMVFDGTKISFGGVSVSPNGVSFPSSQPSLSDPNTLDDYEEGTWTPNITSNNGAGTFATASGSYVKIGRQVTIWFMVDNGASQGGVTQYVTGLPFSVGSIQNKTILGTIGTNGPTLSINNLTTLALNRTVLYIFNAGTEQQQTITYASGTATYWID